MTDLLDCGHPESAHSDFIRDVEVFHFDGLNDDVYPGLYDRKYGAGWYWWSCFPGCLPNSDPIGPFATKAEALADAQNMEG